MAISHGGAGSAVTLTASSQIHVADDDHLDVIQLAIDIVDRARIEPAITHFNWLLDNNAQSFITYEMDGKVRCGIGLRMPAAPARLQADFIHHGGFEGRLDREPLRHW